MSQPPGQDIERPAAGVVVVVLRKGLQPLREGFGRSDGILLDCVEQLFHAGAGEVKPSGVDPRAAAVVSVAAAREQVAERRRERLLVALYSAAQPRELDMDGAVDEALGVGVAVVERAERIEAGCEGVAHEGIPGLEIDQVAACAAFVALPPLLDVAHRAVARQIGAGQQSRTPLLFQQVGEGED